jgi:hypothetical protein
MNARAPAKCINDMKKRRFIEASTGTLLCQEWQPRFCAWKTVVFLKTGTKAEKVKKAKAWLKETEGKENALPTGKVPSA